MHSTFSMMLSTKAISMENTTPARFPPRHLVTTAVICLLFATLTFICSFSQIGTPWPYFIVPSGIGYILTVPYFVHLYVATHSLIEGQRGGTSRGLHFLSTPALVYGFLLITAWVVIFFINILFCVGTTPDTPRGVVLTTVVSGLEWIALTHIALKCTLINKDMEEEESVDPEQQPLVQTDAAAGASDTDHVKPRKRRSYTHYVYLASFIFSMLCLIFSIDVSPSIVPVVFAFLATAPYHLVYFVSAGKSAKLWTFPTSEDPRARVVYSFALVLVWLGIVVLRAICLNADFMVLGCLSMAFGALECIIVTHIAIHFTMEDFSGTGKIQLEGNEN